MLNPAEPSGLPPVLVVLGTHNGARYLCEFAESVRKQSYSQWRMLVRDDASSDATPTKLREIAAEEQRLVVLPDDGARCGPAGNFAKLLQHAFDLGAEYVFLADQDDVWLPEKVRKQIDLIRSAEAAAADGTPILVYSDLTVVDARLQTIHCSFFRQGRFYRDQRQPLKTLLVHNFIPGCCMLINRALMEVALPVPSSAPVHDWWIALCAAATGQLVFLPEPTLLYRQHGRNLIGARGLWTAFNPLRGGWRKRWGRGMVNFAGHVEQTKTLLGRLRQRPSTCPPSALTLLERYCRVLEAPGGGFRRIDGMHQLGIPRASLLRRLVFYARLLGVNR